MNFWKLVRAGFHPISPSGPVQTSFQVDIEIYEDKLGQSGDRILSSHITTNYNGEIGAAGLYERYSVGRCVIPCAFFGKSVKHTFSCRKMYHVLEKKMFTIFLWRFKVTVTSQSDAPFLAYLRLESGVL